jgi:L-rhamnose-H+ transport protein
MSIAEWSGVGIALLAGSVIGSVLVPMKLVRRWHWENTWFAFSICAYLLWPWVVAFVTVPGLGAVYARVSAGVLTITFLLGLGWGLAVILLGIAVDLVGYSISTALLYGSSVAVGSLGALIIVAPAKLLSPEGIRLLCWDVVLTLGVLLCAQAGRVREPKGTADSHRTRQGVAISLLAGVLSTLFNIVLAYGEPIRKQALANGANADLAANAIWSLAVTGGALPSIFWTARLLTKRRRWAVFSETGSARNLLICVAMGAAWISGTVLYSAAAARLGPLGAAFAWPVYKSAIILTGIAWGVGLGEWRASSRPAIRYLWFGVTAQILGIGLLSVAR